MPLPCHPSPLIVALYVPRSNNTKGGTQHAWFSCQKQENGGHVVDGSLCLLPKSDLEAVHTSSRVLFPTCFTIKVVLKNWVVAPIRSFMGRHGNGVQFVEFSWMQPTIETLNIFLCTLIYNFLPILNSFLCLFFRLSNMILCFFIVFFLLLLLSWSLCCFFVYLQPTISQFE